SESAFQRVAHVLKIREQLPGIDSVGYVRPNSSRQAPGDFLLRLVYLFDRPLDQPSLAMLVTPELPELRRQNFEGAVFLALQPARLMQSVLKNQPAMDAYVRLRYEGYVDDGRPQLA